MIEIALVILAAAVGAVVTLVALMHRQLKETKRQLSTLRKRVARAEFASANGGEPEPPEPVRRKRHLGLYRGGGIATILAAIAGRLRDTWQNRPLATVTAAAVTASFGALAYLGIPEGVDEHPRPASPRMTSEAPPAVGAPTTRPPETSPTATPDVHAEPASARAPSPATTSTAPPAMPTEETLEEAPPTVSPSAVPSAEQPLGVPPGTPPDPPPTSPPTAPSLPQPEPSSAGQSDLTRCLNARAAVVDADACLSIRR